MLDPKASRFWQATILSKLMDAESLASCWEAIPLAKRDDPAHIDRRLARQAVHLKSLTLWQAQQLLAGRTAGFKVDRYVLMDLIGQGGMGRVYLAQDTRLNRRVALKILSPERVNNPRAIARFQREARVGAQLQHENLVRIYDFGESNNRYFLVMEYIEGKTIGSLISEQGGVPPETAARLVRQVALGLEHAHRKGLIHRDVNPYNILVTRDGTAKLADLGLAIDLAEEDRVTREGATVGTFDYVAPEQARHSHSADIRSDIYSLGCTLYHMFSGRVPFPGPSLPEKLFSHQALEPTPLQQLVPGLSRGLIEIVQRMMRKSPDDRYPTPLQVAQALEPYAEEPEGAVDPEIATLPPRNSERESAAAITQANLARIGLEKTEAESPPAPNSPALPANSQRLPSTVGSSPPPLSPANEADGSDPDFPVRLILSPEPSLSAGLSRPKVWPAPRQPAHATKPAVSVNSPHRHRLWGLIALGIMIMAVAVVLLVANPFRTEPAQVVARVPQSPTRDADDQRNSAGLTSNETRASRAQALEDAAIVIRTGGDHDIPAKDLAEAIQTAMRNSSWTVELRNHAPLRLTSEKPLEFNSSQGLLVIRAAPGFEPVVEFEMKTPRPLLTTGSGVSLRLFGVTIVAHYPTERTSVTPAPVITAAGGAKFDRCAFRVATNSPVKGSRAIFSNGGALEIERSWFQGFDNAVELSTSNRTPARIKQSMFVPALGSSQEHPAEWYGWGVKVAFVGGAGSPAKTPQPHLILEHCTMEGAGLLDLGGTPPHSPRLRIDVNRCFVRSDALVACKLDRPPNDQIFWQGEGNLYDILGRSWIVLSSNQGTPAFSVAVTDLDSWLAIFPKDMSPNRTGLKYVTNPTARSAAFRPGDFTIEGSGVPQSKPGADPDQVGPD